MYCFKHYRSYADGSSCPECDDAEVRPSIASIRPVYRPEIARPINHCSRCGAEIFGFRDAGRCGKCRRCSTIDDGFFLGYR